ncbi:MAG: aminotransferase class I/II-fold pyridoxal phosphate-dependent enzyme [Brumimicrobium sp.]|nr:aminotransferase class I/II-fold pyridoxal phosphate-dependent enzyme [Brumimicrobium sp.]
MQELKVSKLADQLIGSEIIKLSGEVNKLIGQGEKIFNLTIGDFNPNYFPIPDELKAEILKAYQSNITNYPAANGVIELRNAVSAFQKRRAGVTYTSDEILISGGARPIIYSVYATLVDPNDTVVFAVPSWNNNHYTYLNQAKSVVIEGKPENNFMPSAVDIKPYVKEATLIALCSPQNPTGTVFTKEGLEEICDLILAENHRRDEQTKPLYLLFDEIYWELMMDGVEHYNPVKLRPEMKNYTIFVDGISKSLSATGIRVGWGMGPEKVISKMKSLLTHVGAWAPKAEQIATANFLLNENAYDQFISEQRSKINLRLNGLYKGLKSLHTKGLNIDVIAPQGAIYLTIKLDLIGKMTPQGERLSNMKEVFEYILNQAKIALVPFYAFGTNHDLPWFRLSVGTLALEDIDKIIANLEEALEKLS